MTVFFSVYPLMLTSVPGYATHLVYLTSADNTKEIEHKSMYSILYKKPKRADIYWFIHADTLDDPYTCEYIVDHKSGIPLRVSCSTEN